MQKMLTALDNTEKKQTKKEKKRHVDQKTFPTYISHHEGNVSNCQVKQDISWKDGMVLKIARVMLGHLGVFFPYLCVLLIMQKCRLG